QASGLPRTGSTSPAGCWNRQLERGQLPSHLSSLRRGNFSRRRKTRRPTRRPLSTTPARALCWARPPESVLHTEVPAGLRSTAGNDPEITAPGVRVREQTAAPVRTFPTPRERRWQAGAWPSSYGAPESAETQTGHQGQSPREIERRQLPPTDRQAPERNPQNARSPYSCRRAAE